MYIIRGRATHSLKGRTLVRLPLHSTVNLSRTWHPRCRQCNWPATHELLEYDAAGRIHRRTRLCIICAKREARLLHGS